MEKNIQVQEQKPLTPGFGVAGQVMCPKFKNMCMKQACENFVDLKYGDTFVGRCADSWMPILTVELRQEIEKLRIALKEGGK